MSMYKQALEDRNNFMKEYNQIEDKSYKNICNSFEGLDKKIYFIIHYGIIRVFVYSNSGGKAKLGDELIVEIDGDCKVIS